MKLAIIGTRGIPANHGGFETFAEKISLELIRKGYEIMVVGDNSSEFELESQNGILVRKAQYSKPKNPFKFYLNSFQIANKWKPNIILCCGVGGTIFSRFFGNKSQIVITNPDGLGFLRTKYNLIERILFKAQYFLSALLEKNLVCDSEGILEYYNKNFYRYKNIYVAEYGTDINPYVKELNGVFTSDILIDIKPKEYYLVVARLEPENNIKMIIEGFILSGSLKKLVIVGSYNTRHYQDLKQYENDNIVFIGGIYNKDKLQIIRANCFAYFHGHSVGGTNPSLLEAMGSNNLCICHSNIFNRAICGDLGFYFNSSQELKSKILWVEKPSNKCKIERIRKEIGELAKNSFNWEIIVNKYSKIFNEIAKI